MTELRVLPAGWARGTLVTITGLLTVVVALGDLASAWVVLVLPMAVAAVVGYHEVLERLVRPRPQTVGAGDDGAGAIGYAEKPGADGTPA
ncbi:hypothetical protein MXD61_00180 [Frankia sp. AgPm24]|uniref:hypothetical protein n=1 Tax=Frankia sp. AgPm24 TaxID=631128 RepID=UPI00200C8C5C|nr:hypothetical protein [Frankia sp. AgPm24]MCK9920344.1 hypothetical protein [Frankia sp. AgPm24]